MALSGRMLSSSLLKQIRNVSFIETATYHSKAASRVCGFSRRKSALFSSFGGRLSVQHFSSTGSRTAAGETNLSAFLKEEIEAEKQHARENFQSESIREFPGFQLRTDQAEIILTRSHGSETITVSFNVNHAVEPAEEAPDSETNVSGEQQEAAPMIARPPFLVEISKENQKLTFACQIANPADLPEGEGDLFQIEEIYVYEGEETEKTYSSSASVIDGALYDHLMRYLEERGVDNAFAQNLMQLATHYEHSLYVGLLQKIREFVSQ